MSSHLFIWRKKVSTRSTFGPSVLRIPEDQREWWPLPGDSAGWPSFPLHFGLDVHKKSYFSTRFLFPSCFLLPRQVVWTSIFLAEGSFITHLFIAFSTQYFIQQTIMDLLLSARFRISSWGQRNEKYTALALKEHKGSEDSIWILIYMGEISISNDSSAIWSLYLYAVFHTSLLRYNWRATLYKFKVHNMLIWYYRSRVLVNV